MKTSAKNNDMTQGAILPVLIRFTIPILLGDMFQQFYNIVDTIIVGRTLGTGALAAVGATGTLMFLIVGVSSTLANGFAVVTAQRFGAHDEDGIHRSFTNGLVLTALIVGIITAVSLLLIRKLLVWMNTPADIYDGSLAYISVILMGLEVTAFYNYLAANLRAIGNSRIPLYFLILASFMNILLDLFFIVGLHMGTEGASTATVASQMISVLGCGVYIYIKEPFLRPRRKDWVFDKEICKTELAIGVPMALQNAITASGTVVMQSATNIFGSTVVAANTAASKVRLLFTQEMISMGSSIATYCGQNYGNRNMKRVKDGVIAASKVMIVYSLVSGLLANLILPLGMRLFVSDASSMAEMLPWAQTYMHITAIFFIPLAIIFICRNALQACGHSVFAMSAGFVELVSRLIFAWLAIHFEKYPLAVMCDCAAWLSAGIYLAVAFAFFMKKDSAESEGQGIA